MGQPAARLGDPTAHGGVLTLGCPTVLIGGQPAARMGDMHVCPMQTPAVVPIPHVGGPVLLGSVMVLIGGQPAARMGDMVMCVGPPATILMGCPTVLIGEGGSGSASGGGGGSASSAVAAASAATASGGNKESTSKVEHWIEFAFTDSAGLPLSGIPYVIKTPDGKESTSVLRVDGRVTRDSLSQGQCKVQLIGVRDAQWSKNKAEVGDTVKWSAKIDGYNDGTPAQCTIFRRDLTGPDVAVQTIEGEVSGSKFEGSWKYAVVEQAKAKSDEGKKPKLPEGYSAPEYYFEVVVKACKTRSGLLGLNDKAEVKFLDHEGKPMKDVKYTLRVASGEIRKGTLDGQGKAKLENLVPGPFAIRFEKRSTYKRLSRKSR